MELRFNELSSFPLFTDKYIAHDKMMEFAKTAKAARDRNIKHIKSDYRTDEIKLTNSYTMYNWLFDKEFFGDNRDIRVFLQGMITPPFIDDDRTDEYISSDYFFEDRTNGITKNKCIGLAAAYLYDALSISFQNGSAWTKNRLTIIIKRDSLTLQEAMVFNVFSRDCFLNTEIKDCVEQANDIHLVETAIPPNDKIAHFSAHHGKAELEKFWGKLIKNPYIISARSTNWGGNSFIRKINRNGWIEIVLVNTDFQYALQIETTGRNFYETKYIAKILKDTYA